MEEDFKQVLTTLVNVKTGEKYKRWLTEKQAENLPFHICLEYEAEDRKRQL